MARSNRVTLKEMDYLSPGKKARLYRMLYQYGPANGTLLFLPYDHGMEHGPMDFYENPTSVFESLDPEFIFRLAVEGGYSGVATHFGLASKYYPKYAGKVPLILKLNGKTNIPSDVQAFSPLTSHVEDAVRLGADAVGYTLYVGTPRQDEDMLQLNQVRRDCDKYGMPLIIWSYPRGEAIEKKGGRDSFYAVDYAARMASEMGADLIKLNLPKFDRIHESPKPYNEIKLETKAALQKVIQSAGKSMVLLSGGSKLSDTDAIAKARIAFEAGATGLLFGRNMWQRAYEDALDITRKMKEMVKEFSV
ncbi:MAG: class I fructose-bisphosphate aldolase [bacterium]